MSEQRRDDRDGDGPGFVRRSLLKRAAGAGAGGLLMPVGAMAAGGPAARRRELAATKPLGGRAHGAAPVPKVVRSQRALLRRAVEGGLPITQNGTTYEMAQEVRWLDGDRFAVGRWDGSMSIFSFETAPYAGPEIQEAVNSPAFQGTQMITPLPGNAIATSNDDGSIALWHAAGGDWTKLRLVGVPAYDPALGVARAGAALTGTSPARLVVGHTSGFLTLWSYDHVARVLTFEQSVDVRNPNPVNPWGDHTIEDLVVADAASSVVAAGSEDGYVTLMAVPSGQILSQTVFNSQAQRGINAVAVAGDRLLVANCAVGSSDHNLWLFGLDTTSWGLTLLDQSNLVIDTTRAQVFNFDVTWGRYSGGRCWFASTEEGALWMGTATGSALQTIGYQQLTGPLGSALDYRQGRLAMVSYDLYQFTTGA
jgi:hypothetical protein